MMVHSHDYYTFGSQNSSLATRERYRIVVDQDTRNCIREAHLHGQLLAVATQNWRKLPCGVAEVDLVVRGATHVHVHAHVARHHINDGHTPEGMPGRERERVGRLYCEHAERR